MEYIAITIRGAVAVGHGSPISLRIGVLLLLPLLLRRFHSLLPALLFRQHFPFCDGFRDGLECSRRQRLLQHISSHISSGQSVLDDVRSDLFFVIGDTKSEWTLTDQKKRQEPGRRRVDQNSGSA